MNMHNLRNYKNRYCGQCPKQECGVCRVKGFVGYVGLQETPRSSLAPLMRTSMPLDVEHRENKYVQKHGRVVK